jgi:hypothetical protein
MQRLHTFTQMKSLKNIQGLKKNHEKPNFSTFIRLSLSIKKIKKLVENGLSHNQDTFSISFSNFPICHFPIFYILSRFFCFQCQFGPYCENLVLKAGYSNIKKGGMHCKSSFC